MSFGTKWSRENDHHEEHHWHTPPKQGSIRFKGEEIIGIEPYLLTRKGIGYIPDDQKNLCRPYGGRKFGDSGEKEAKEGEGWRQGKSLRLFPALKNIESRKGGCLSGGEQKMLAIARALMGNPEFILLDEPFEGLAPLLVYALEGQIKKLREAGLTVFIAEQNVRSTLRISDRGYIIDNGQIRYHGSIEELRDNEEVRKKYLLV